MRLCYLFQRLVVIVTHHVTVLDNGVNSYSCTDADHRAGNMTRVDNASVRYYGLLQMCAGNLRRRQHPRAGINGVLAKQVELRDIIRQPEVGLKERRYRTDVRPVALVLVANHTVTADRLR